MKNVITALLAILLLGFTFCTDQETSLSVSEHNLMHKIDDQPYPIIDTTGTNIATRFSTPQNFERIQVRDSSFGSYLRKLPLKPHGCEVSYFNGQKKSNKNIYCAVVDLPIGNRDLHQCADAVMRLRADYLREQKRFEDIHFTFNNGFEARYDKWMKGYRIHFDGTDFYWTKDSEASNSDASYWKYLEYVFSFAGTYSLAQELPAIDEKDMKIGDVFIWGGNPGHAVIVVDMAINKATGDKVFMLAQSYMPAQEIQILVNPKNHEIISPWYAIDFGEYLHTPEWRFEKGFLKRF